MADLHTTYMGFELKNPLLPSASPLSRKLDDIKALEDAGAPGIVLYSLFEEQVSLESGELSHLLEKGAASLADASAYFPQTNDYPRDPDHYVEHVRQAKEAVDIPIIASVNGTSVGGWMNYAQKIEDAGADVANVCSVLLQNGVPNLSGMLEDLERRLDELQVDSIAILKGSLSLEHHVEPTAFERAGYIKLLQGYGRI